MNQPHNSRLTSPRLTTSTRARARLRRYPSCWISLAVAGFTLLAAFSDGARARANQAAEPKAVERIDQPGPQAKKGASAKPVAKPALPADFLRRRFRPEPPEHSQVVMRVMPLFEEKEKKQARIREMNLRPGLRTQLEAEYRFLRAACKPGKEQRMAIAKAAFQSIDKLELVYAEWRLRPGQSTQPRDGENYFELPPFPTSSAIKGPFDLPALIRADLKDAARIHLTPTQLEQYLAELKIRDDDEREALILQLISKLNWMAFLTKEQEDKLKVALMSQWDESWRRVLRANMMIYVWYVPKFPESVVSPILSSDQWELVHAYQPTTVSLEYGITSRIEGEQDPNLDDEFTDAMVESRKEEQ